MKISKKEKQEIIKWVLDYFVDVIMPTCGLHDYEVNVHLEFIPNKDKDTQKTFSISLNFPYRRIDLYIREGGVKYYRQKDIAQIRRLLFHEAFHIFHWRFKDYAFSRFVDPGTLEEMEEDMADKFSIIMEILYSNQKKK